MIDYFAHPTSVIDNDVLIGKNTKVWHFSHITTGAQIGDNCTIGQNVFIGGKAKIGKNVKIQNNVSIFDSVEIETSGTPAMMGYCHCKDCASWSASSITAATLWSPRKVSK